MYIYHIDTHTLKLLLIIKDEQVSQTIEKLFYGCRVLLLLDCCAAGNLCYHLPSTATIDDGSSTNNDDTMMMREKKKQYVLLASRYVRTFNVIFRSVIVCLLE